MPASGAEQAGLSIGDIVARTGVGEGSLRMWERRYGFPRPMRLPGGHRRYTERDVELVLQVVRERDAGLSLATAIARAREAEPAPERSIFAGLRRRRPDLQPLVLRKPVLLALTRAIEDESCARAERPLLVGSFQRRRFYRQSERRWREFARTADLAIVFADFDRVEIPEDGPAEVPVQRSHPLTREWAVVCDAPGHCACLAAVEVVQAHRRADADREFEVLWSVEPALVRVASDIALGLARAVAPEIARRVERRATAPPPQPPSDEQLRLATAIATRALHRV